ncbi:hypothetical protein R1H25_17825 [Stenotrophomonas sp. C2852]|uniref:hypothetical protein n=1 Tax=Stenotrophomonas sp. C2852 TaxID=3077845 RepID=UPI00293C37B9|nr:hypothetical protein [Stenotrophomonas sp. C2852]MDV3437322.1 hypothetical protein [Stenotrophomonas sp. C2852]
MKEFLYWTFVRCWPLGEKCEVNWDAWAAIGTCAAVVIALFGPAIHRMVGRRKANALFALAYRTDIQGALARLENLNSRFPLDPKGDSAWAVHETLTKEGQFRTNFIEICGRLDELTGREVDLTKWPAVDWSLAAKVAMAIETTAHFQMGARLLADVQDDVSWSVMMQAAHLAHVRATTDVATASEAINKALGAFSITGNQA